MKNNFFNRFASVAVAFLLMASILGPAQAEEYKNTDSLTPREENVFHEATTATLGRVFGVEGHGGNVAYYSIDFSVHSPQNAALRSALVPGWGQLFNQHKVKGSLIMATTAVTAIAAVSLYGQSRDSYDDYKSLGVKGSSKYDDYSRQYTQAAFLGGVTLALWTFAVIDAYRNAYNPLWSTQADNQIQVAADSTGAQVTWSRKF